MFPSPYGVIFILIILALLLILGLYVLGFPSPYGVIFILIFDTFALNKKNNLKVSVSLRSYIHSYVILLQYLYSLLKSFRLLTELYSFLWYMENLEEVLREYSSFRLLTELYSFLYGKDKFYRATSYEFPSPYGVIFILIFLFQEIFMKTYKKFVSVSLRSYIHSYLFQSLKCKYSKLLLPVSVSLRSYIHSYLPDGSVTTETMN